MSFILTGDATKDVKPVVRFVLPDTELGTVVEECVDMGHDEGAWDKTEMSRTVEGSQPCEHIRKRKAKGIGVQHYQYMQSRLPKPVVSEFGDLTNWM